ncbi:MAG: MATE family efflux transporter [Clostridiales bacterium]|nr:MATE family efflux transporter [Clostridiales bacterium]
MKTVQTHEEKFRMMTEAPIPGLIGKLAVPTIISMLITSIYNMADTFFVGQIGTSATAAVGIVFPLMSVIQALGFFFGHGSGNAISRKLGEKDTKESSHLAAAGFFLALLTGLCITILGLLFLNPLAVLLGATPTSLNYVKDYLGIILLGAPWMTASLVLNNQLRFQGSAFYSMIGIASGGILNIILDPVFIFGFRLGISGAAIATILSQFVSFCLLLAGTRRGGNIRIRFSCLKLSRERFRTIASGGLPSLFRQGLGSISVVALNLAARPYGDAAIAAMSVVSRITFFAASALIGFGQGFQPVCGFNFGAKQFGRVREAFWFCMKIAVVLLTVFAVAGFVFAEPLIACFRKDDAEVIRIGALALRLQCLTFPLQSWIVLNNMMLQTIGKTFKASLLAMSRQGLFFLPVILVLPLFFGIAGIQFSQPIADICSFILALPLGIGTLKELKKPV